MDSVIKKHFHLAYQFRAHYDWFRVADQRNEFWKEGRSASPWDSCLCGCGVQPTKSWKGRPSPMHLDDLCRLSCGPGEACPRTSWCTSISLCLHVPIIHLISALCSRTHPWSRRGGGGGIDTCMTFLSTGVDCKATFLHSSSFSKAVCAVGNPHLGGQEETQGYVKGRFGHGWGTCSHHMQHVY